MESIGKSRVGFLTTYQAAERTSILAAQISAGFHSDEIVILAETSCRSTQGLPTEIPVEWCWSQEDRDFSALSQAMHSHHVEVLHVLTIPNNIQEFQAFLRAERRRGVRVVIHFHTLVLEHPEIAALVPEADWYIVTRPENKARVIALGAPVSQISVIDPGASLLSVGDPLSARSVLGIPTTTQLLVTFGFLGVEKGIDGIIDALRRMTEQRLSQAPTAEKIQLVVICPADRQNSERGSQYLQALRSMVSAYGLQEKVQFIDSFISEEKLSQYLQAADVVVLNSTSTEYRESLSLRRALGAGAAVVASSSPSLSDGGHAVLYASGQFGLQNAITQVLSNPALKATLCSSARSWAEERSFENGSQSLALVYSHLRSQVSTREQASASVREQKSSGLRVLMQNRPNAFEQRGGDTVLMEKAKVHLASLGVSVEFDLTGKKNPADYDLVHLFNFATPEITRVFAEKAVSARVPYVVTALYEDAPSFYNQKEAYFNALQDYVLAGQPSGRWEEFARQATNVRPSGYLDNSWTATHAAALIVTGENEKVAIRRDYPNVEAIRSIQFGCEVAPYRDGGEQFIQKYGIKDFILCVGRLETRKNQLMLMKALENCELPVIFVDGGFTYQPAYAGLLKRFRRAGNTLFTGHLEPEMLMSAFCAARVHALPSWYELPGLVSLEAARYGCNVVVTDRGTARDYLGENAFYCNPDDPASIYNATLAAYYSPSSSLLQQKMEALTWEKSALQLKGVYDEVISKQSREKKTAAYVLPEWEENRGASGLSASLEVASVQAREAVSTVSQLSHIPDRAALIADQLCSEGDKLLKTGQAAEAYAYYRRALTEAPRFGRAYRSCGVVGLVEKEYSKAKGHFEEALSIDGNDVKSLVGIGSAFWGQGQTEQSYKWYIEALRRAPDDLNALHGLIQASYALNRFESLQPALVGYVQRHPQDKEMRFCLAGCLFKQMKLVEAKQAIGEILAVDPNFNGALQLRTAIEQRSAR